MHLVGYIVQIPRKNLFIYDISVTTKKIAEAKEERCVAEVANALSWLISNDVTKECDAPLVASFGSMGSAFASMGPVAQDDTTTFDWLRTNRGTHMPEDESEAPSQAIEKPLSEEEQWVLHMQNALNLLKAGTNNMDDITVSSLRSVGQTGPEKVASEMDVVLDFLRKACTRSIDDPSVVSEARSRGPMTAEEKKAQTTASAMDWLRGNSANAFGIVSWMI
jgi:hypothetical protein